MIYFIYGQDSYRAKRKLKEIILGYKKVHKSGLNLIYIDASEPASAKGFGEAKKDFKDFYSNLKITSMFAEKKLIILKNVFSVAMSALPVEQADGRQTKFQEDFLKNIENLEDMKDIVIIYEDKAPDKRTKFFKALTKNVPTAKSRQSRGLATKSEPSRIHDPQQVEVGTKCQEFNYLQPAMLKKWVVQEFGKNKAKINPDALDLLANFIGSDLWNMANEINKLSNYKTGFIIKKEDVELLVKPNIENDIFKTIDALVSKDKRLALSLLHKHLDDGTVPLYLLSMISYQFRNLLIIKELQDAQKPYAFIIKKSGLHPFVAQKIYYLGLQFSMSKLKKIYQKIFQIDSDIKTGKIEAETALDLLLSEI